MEARLMKVLKKNKDMILCCIIGLFLGMILSNNIVLIAEVDGISMEPTYYEYDRLLVCRLLEPDRGDIVVFNNCGKPYIKRVIAVGGDTITIKDSKVILNGEVLKEDYIVFDSYEGGLLEDEELLIKEGEYFVMGDNRQNSNDSRNFGVVYKEEIVGVKLINLW